jgi:signal peptidase I
VSLENSPDQPLGSVAPESPVDPENPWSVSPEAVQGETAAVNGVHVNGVPSETVLAEPALSESMPGETMPVESIPAGTEAPPQDGGVDESEAALQAETGVSAVPQMVRSTVSEWVITILLLLFLTTTLVQAFVIPTGSMEQTLLVGDHLLVDKLAYAPSGPISKYILPYLDVKRGDIIVFRYPTDIQQTFVKRCMGIPGDHIRIVNKQVYINGKALVEPYIYEGTDFIDSYRNNFPSEPNVTLEPGGVDMLENHVVNGEVVVPPNSYFAMGDNRENSWDSRYWGFVPRQNIIGKPLIIYWSYDRPSDQLNSNSVTLPQMLDLAEHFFSKTRWNRAFMLIHGYPVQ